MLKFISTRFGKQQSNCKIKPGVDLTPTQEEIDLSCLVRPGMHGGREIKQLLNAGKFYFDDSTHNFLPDYSSFPPVNEARQSNTEKPNLVYIEKAIWREANSKDWTVTISGHTGVIKVPVETATDAKIGYYGCRILQKHDRIELSQRCMVTDFIYEKNYFEDYVINILGGSGIEHHSFAHVDTPLEENSGYLVLGKIQHDTSALELTAFKVPKGTSVYIPQDTVHSNDYLLGRWETLIAPACNFPSAKLKALDRSGLKLEMI